MNRTSLRALLTGVVCATMLSLAAGTIVAQDAADATEAQDPMATTEPMAPGITVRDAWTRASMMVELAGAAYMVIHNGDDAEDTLIGASSPAAATVEIHESQMDADGAMSMRHIGRIALAPHADTVLEPGGYHLMLIDLAEPLTEGTTIELSLEFATAAPQTVALAVSGPMGMGPGTADDMGMDGMDTDGDMGDDMGLEPGSDDSEDED